MPTPGSDSISLDALVGYTIAGGKDKPVMTFGEDEDGEIYFTDSFGRIFWFASKE